eukprot:11365.XXX_620889_621038_1 [CDS] Oithona nana genome sequencing.
MAGKSLWPRSWGENIWRLPFLQTTIMISRLALTVQMGEAVRALHFCPPS